MKISQAEIERIRAEGGKVRVKKKVALKPAPPPKKQEASDAAIATIESAKIVSASLQESRQALESVNVSITTGIAKVSREIRSLGEKKKRFVFKLKRDHRGQLSSVDVLEI